ncbi:MAG: Omp28 family outer membrane lipoprotein [Bacteroidales bacterium]|nr:Omp28 family outer membrane lipoprotein [Bacteroidales bacterium]
MNKITTILSLLLTGLLLTACDKIDEDERYTPAPSYTPARSILIEDYTGQKCANCPFATNTLHSLTEYFGDSVVCVAIHGGSFGVNEPNGLATAEARSYYEKLNINSQPIGVINHRGFTTNFENWTKEVCNLITTPSTVSMSARAWVEGDELKVSVNSSASDEMDAIMKVWLTEDGLVANQNLPVEWGGGTDKNYTHNHVYRKSVADVEGVKVQLSPESVKREFSCSLKSTYKMPYNVANLYVVAFVYTEKDGVLKVLRQKVEASVTE